MITNQTIDGVPRRICHACVTLARNAYCPVCDDTPAAQPHGEEFSAVGWSIDHTAGRPILVHNNCSVIEAEQAYGVLELIRKSEQPQGEPFAWYTEDYLTDKSATTYDLATMERWKAKGWPVAPLYAEQPAPVAVNGAAMNELRHIFDSNKGADGSLVISKSLAAQILNTK